MKHIFKFSFIALLAVIFMTACKKEENQAVFSGGTAPALSSTLAGPVTLLKANAANFLFSMTWTDPNYYMNTGISSQDVNYALQMDTTGGNKWVTVDGTKKGSYKKLYAGNA